MPDLSGELLFVLVLVVPALTALFFGLRSTLKTKLQNESMPINYWGSYTNTAAVRHFRGVPLPDIPDEEIHSETHHHIMTVHP